MKRKLLFAFLMLLAAGANAQEQICKETNTIAYNERLGHARLAGNKSPSAASANFTVHYYKCEWTINPAQNYITGRVTPHFIITVATSSLTFDLHNQLVVDSVVMRSTKLTFSRGTNNTLTIQLGRSYAVAEKDSLSIFYKGVPAGGGFGSFVQTYHGSKPVVWTLSEPYGAKDWWPCRNGLDDKADSIDIYVTHPSAYTTSSNGWPADKQVVGANTISHYRHRYPIASYLVAIAVTNFSTFTDNVQLKNGLLPVLSYIYPEDSAGFHNSINLMLNAMKLYDSIYADYPYLNERYGQTEFGWGGGMEHQTNSFITSYGENLMAHELAHQWFGDKVTCGSWQDIWLNEGFATFCADFLYTERYNPTLLASYVSSNLSYIVSYPTGSVWVNDTTDIGRIFDSRLSYDKGAFLLRMLRFTLGDKKFFKGISNYLNDPKLAYNFARTIDLQHHLEAVSGQDLTYFFNQWFYGQGYPSFTVSWSQNATTKKATISVTQTTSNASVTFYKTPLPLLFRSGTKKKRVIINIDSNDQSYLADIGFIADTVLVDPDQYIISAKNKTIHLTAAKPQVAVSPNPFTDRLAITYKETAGKKILLQLLNNSGQLITAANIVAAGGQQQYTMYAPANLPPGIYMLHVNVDGKVSSQTLIKK